MIESTPAQHPAPTGPLRRGLVRWAGRGALAAATLAGWAILPSLPASAAPLTTLYAYAGGTDTSSSTCPADAGVTPSPAAECSLAQALAVTPSDGTTTIYLGSSDSSDPYASDPVDGFTLTSSSASVTIEPLPGADVSYLEGPAAAGHTGAPTLTISGDADTVVLSELYFEDGSTVNGGAIDVTAAGDAVSVEGSTFDHNAATGDGGAIDAADGGGTSTLVLDDDVFEGDSAGGNGGAIALGLAGGSGTLMAAASSFTSNTATGSGGAIDAGGAGGWGSLSLDNCSFSLDAAGANGGAIDAGDAGATSLLVTTSSFQQNTATGDGGAIDAADQGGTLALGVLESPTVYANLAALDNLTFTGPASLQVINEIQPAPRARVTSTTSARVGSRIWVAMACSFEPCSGTLEVSAVVQRRVTVLATGTYTLAATSRGIASLHMTTAGTRVFAAASPTRPVRVTIVGTVANGAGFSAALNVL